MMNRPLPPEADDPNYPTNEDEMQTIPLIEELRTLLAENPSLAIMGSSDDHPWYDADVLFQEVGFFDDDESTFIGTVSPHVVAILLRAIEAAWDEGVSARSEDSIIRRSPQETLARNPYRKAAQ